MTTRRIASSTFTRVLQAALIGLLLLAWSPAISADDAPISLTQFGTSAFDSVESVAIDAAGNMYVSGHVSTAVRDRQR